MFLIVFLGAFISAKSQGSRGDFYQIRVYHISSPAQEKSVEDFLKNDYLPALHRAGVGHVGVFKPIETDSLNFGKRIFVLIPYHSPRQHQSADSMLINDAALQQSTSGYATAPYDHPPYDRMETIFAKAFPDALHYQVPTLTGPVGDRIYELRSYEGATEKIFASKVKMFNAGDEIGLFKRLGFNAVFYSEVVAGSKMPNLMYMTCFNDIQSRETHWKAFVESREWKHLISLPEYQHNISHIDIFLLHPAPYSDL